MNAVSWRRLGIAEEAMNLLESERGSAHIVQVLVLEDVELDPEVLGQALRALAHRFQLLRARIEPTSDGLMFVRGPELADVVRVLAREHDDMWVDVVNAELNTPFDHGDPLIRVTLLTAGDRTHSEILLTCHHAVVDGEALELVTRDLLATYDGLSRGDHGRRTPSAAPLPAVENILRYPLSPAFQSGPLRAFVERQILMREEHVLAGFDASTAAEASHSAVVHQSLPRLVIDAVRSRSRAEGTSVHGALGAALLAAGRDEVVAGRSGTLPLVTAVSLRRRLPELVDAHIGLFSSGIRSAHRVDRSTSFWSLAREVTHGVTAGLDADEDVCALLLQLEAVRHYMSSEEGGFAWLSDPGLLDVPQHVAGGRVRAVHGAFTMHALGPVVHAHASTFGEQFTWNFVHPEPAISRAACDALASRAVEHLVSSCRDDLPASTVAAL